MNIANYFLIASIIINLVIICIILFKTKKNLAELFFAGMISCTIFLSLGFLLLDINVYFFNSIIYTSAILLIYFLLLFSYYFPYKISYINIKLLFLYFVPILFLLILNLTNNLIIGETSSNLPIYGPLYLVFPIIVFVYLIISIINLIFKFFKSKGIEKIQLYYLSIGIIATSICIVGTNIILPLIGIHSLGNIGPSFTIFLDISIFYVIIKHRFFNIRFIIGDIIYTMLLALYVNIIFFAIILIELKVFRSLFDPNVIVFDIAVSFLFTVVFLFLNDKISQLRMVYTGIDSQNRVFKTVRDMILKDIELEHSLKEIFNYIKDIIKVDNIFVVADFGDERYLLCEDVEFNKILLDNNVINDLFSINREVYVTLEEKKKSDFTFPYELLYKYNINCEVLFDIEKQSKTMFFTQTKDVEDKVFTIEEIKFLNDVFKEIALFINRAFLHKKVLDFNKTLQTKVDMATNELKEKNEALQKAYEEANETARQERDMLDIMGHELRTPATVIKMASYLLGNKTNDEYTAKQVDRIKDSIERQIRLINTFINTAKLDNDRMELHVSPIHLEDLVKASVEDNLSESINKGLSLTFVDNGQFPELYADKAMIREVIDNLITNAIKYTSRGTIEVSCKKSEDGKDVVVAVKDTGEGMSEDEKLQLFQKFKRLHNYTTSSNPNAQQILRPGGTGLGLYVSKKVVELHSGKIWVESILGTGSTFYFSLPIEGNKPNGEFVAGSGSSDLFERLRLK